MISNFLWGITSTSYFLLPDLSLIPGLLLPHEAINHNAFLSVQSQRSSEAEQDVVMMSSKALKVNVGTEFKRILSG